MDGHDIAQICLNGHVIASTAGSSPQFRKNRCDTCGEETIMTCKSCKTPIKGYYHVSGFIDFNMSYSRPRFCESCGKPFPWIETKIDVANQLIDLMDSLNEDEKLDFKDSISELVKETSKVPVAKVKVNRYLTKVDSDLSDGLLDVLKETLSEKIKKSFMK